MSPKPSDPAKHSLRPFPPVRFYEGRRTAEGCIVTVYDGDTGTTRLLDPRFDLRTFSTSGFAWGGRDDGGASQLALALLADASGDDRLALKHYRWLKRDWVMKQADQWHVTNQYIRGGLELDLSSPFSRN